MRWTFLVTLIAGIIALSGGLVLYKSEPHEGGRTTKSESAKTANQARQDAIWNEQRSGALA